MNIQEMSVKLNHMRDSSYRPPESTLLYLDLMAWVVVGAVGGLIWWLA